MGMAMGPGGHGNLQSFSKDRSVNRHQLAPGTLRRIAGFARPYRVKIVLFVLEI